MLDDSVLEGVPLKIKYLREFMEAFELVKYATDDEQAMLLLTHCAAIALKQYHPDSPTVSEVEDMVNMPIVYEIIDVAAGIKVDPKKAEEEDQTVKDQAVESGSSWETLDLAKLESEVFLLGIWKDYAELEASLSMPELLTTLGSKRELDYNEKKFLAAIQGVDLDKQSGKQNEWEEMKARVFSKGQAANSNDILALQGVNAQRAGFGIGLGLDYESIS